MHFDSSWIFLYDMWCYMHWRGNTNNWWLQIPQMHRITVCPVWKVQTKQNDFTYKLDNPQMVVVGGTLGGKLKLGWQFFMCHFKQSKPNQRDCSTSSFVDRPLWFSGPWIFLALLWHRPHLKWPLNIFNDDIWWEVASTDNMYAGINSWSIMNI